MTGRHSIQKARQALESARALLELGDTMGAINRAYYAAFYVVREAVELRGSRAKSHSGLASEFGRLFVVTGDLPRKAAASFGRLQSKRELVDYGDEADTSDEDAASLIKEAEDLIRTLTALIERTTDS